MSKGSLQRIILEWNIKFAMACQSIWRWRNEAIFEQVQLDEAVKVGCIIRSFEETVAAFSRRVSVVSERRQPNVPGWVKPTGGYIKLNVDGAVNESTGRASIGCVVRDTRGRWVSGEVRSLGRVRPLTAELCAIHFGLLLAWRKGFQKLVLETDCLEAKNLIMGYKDGSVEDRALIQIYKELLARHWEVKVIHVPRESNYGADWLAK